MNGTIPPDESGRSLGTLLRDLTHDVADLVRSEIALARAETSEKVSQAGTAIASIAVGAVIGLAALIIVLQAVVIALAEIMEPWLASAIVGIVVAALAWYLIWKGQNDLKAGSLMPERTVRNVRKDAQVVTDHSSTTTAETAETASLHPIKPAQPADRRDTKQEAHR
jgi:apolipoprotein N-acyltransferase